MFWIFVVVDFTELVCFPSVIQKIIQLLLTGRALCFIHELLQSDVEKDVKRNGPLPVCHSVPPTLPGASPAGFSVSLLAGMTTVQRCCSTLNLFISHSSPRILPGFGDCLALWKPSCFARFSPPLLPSTGPATSFNTFPLPLKNQQPRAIIFTALLLQMSCAFCHVELLLQIPYTFRPSGISSIASSPWISSVLIHERGCNKLPASIIYK